jgi:hypothetical protein
MSLYPPRRALPLIALTSLVLTGCFGSGSDTEKGVKESFNSDNTYSRVYPHPPAQACEAARRTLLSEGYTVSSATAELVQGTKNFQPKNEVHEQLAVRVSCEPHEQDGSWVFVSAVQDRYSLKKSPTSASVGVSVLGSVSLPIGASDDSLVRVGSVTVEDTAFYKAFFDRLGQYLPRPKTAAKTEPDAQPETTAQAPAPAPTMPSAVAAPAPDQGRGSAP